MSAAAGLLGCMMLVYGGFNTESKKALDDMKVFDMEQMKWIETKIYKDNQRIDEKLESLRNEQIVYNEDYYIG